MAVSSTFSEHWHRVANLRLSLRPTVEMRKRFFGDEPWFIIVDPLNNHYFRITAGAHRVLRRLDGQATVQQVWEAALVKDPDGAPGQEELIELLGQLHQANLLRGEIPADNARVFERYKKRRAREVRSFFNLMFLRIPVFDPDGFLRRTLPMVRWLISPVGALLWLGIIATAVKVALDHAPALRAQSEGVLSPANLPLLYAGLVLIKVLHEFGHAFACRHWGGEVHEMGVALMYFSPVPYVDASASWAFRSKWRRIFVSSAGMIVELLIASLAVFIWAATGEGTLHNLAYNMIFVASVTTLFFNANPLMRYDGYYILSDLLDQPNLQQRSMEMLRHLAERWIFGVRSSESPARTFREAFFLTLFGSAGWLYRLLLFTAIALYLSEQFLLLGVILALFCLFSFTIKPIWKLLIYLVSSPRLARTRTRAVLITGGATALIFLGLALWPAPSRFRAPGVLRAEEYSELFTSTPGILSQILATPGAAVTPGQPLLQLVSPELDLETAGARAALAQVIAQEERALDRAAAELPPIRSRRELAEKRVRRLEDQRRTLVLVAPHAGTWVSSRLEDRVGQWFPRGQLLGQIVQAAEFRFSAVISQEEAANLFSGNLQTSEVRVVGQAATALAVKSVRVIPAEQQLLPSAALGWGAGGEVAVSSTDPAGTRAAEPFFELRAGVSPQPGVKLLHGRSGKIRVNLRSEPLLAQWYRKTRQLLQKKYQL
jgi:putative peptide zinc metalloprotease protein